jgi:hypothetical protein
MNFKESILPHFLTDFLYPLFNIDLLKKKYEKSNF